MEDIYRAISSGWSLRFKDADVQDLWDRAKRKLVICAHTTPFVDGIVLHCALDKLKVPHVIYVRGLWCLCPFWCQEIRGGGFVAREVCRLEQQETFCRALFPSGGTLKWKTGFYHIAKATGASVFAFGLDYKERAVVVDSRLDPASMSAKELTGAAKTKLAKYAPGPIYVSMRVSIGYGDVVYDIATWKVWMMRFLAGTLICVVFILMSSR